MTKIKDDLSDLDLIPNDDLSDLELVSNDEPKTSTTLAEDAESILRGGVEGASLGFSDEITGGLGALKDAILSDETLLDAYVKHRDEARANNLAAKERSPYLYGAGEIVGGFASGGGLAKLAAKGVPLATALASENAIKAGIASGAAAGLGYNQNEKDIVKDVAMGGAIGGLIPGVVKLGSAAVKGIGNLISGNLVTDTLDIAKTYTKGDLDVIGDTYVVERFAKEKAREASKIIDEFAGGKFKEQSAIFGQILEDSADKKLSVDEFISRIIDHAEEADIDMSKLLLDKKRMSKLLRSYDNFQQKTTKNLAEVLPDTQATKAEGLKKLERLLDNRGQTLNEVDIGDLRINGDNVSLPFSQKKLVNKGMMGNIVQDTEEVLNLDRAAQELQDKADLNAIKMNFDNPESVVLNDQARLTKDKMLGQITDPMSENSRVLEVDIPVDVFKTNNMQASQDMINARLMDNLTRQGIDPNSITNLKTTFNPETGKVILNYDIIKQMDNNIPVDMQYRLQGLQDLSPSDMKSVELLAQESPDKLFRILAGKDAPVPGGQKVNILEKIVGENINPKLVEQAAEARKLMAASSQLRDKVSPLVKENADFLKDVEPANQLAENLTQMKNKLNTTKNEVGDVAKTLGMEDSKLVEYNKLLDEATRMKELNTRYKNSRSFAGGDDGLVKTLFGSGARLSMNMGKLAGIGVNKFNKSISASGLNANDLLNRANQSLAVRVGAGLTASPKLPNENELSELHEIVKDKDPAFAEEIRNATTRQEKALIQYKALSNPVYKKMLMK